MAVMTVGCSKLQSGGGARSITVGGQACESVYGIRDGDRLAFIVFTDITSDGTVVSAGSDWSGKIAPSSGEALAYDGSSEAIQIDGTDYQFENGRVFLVSGGETGYSVTQVDLPLEDTAFRKEIDRITQVDDVQAFLNP